MKEKDKGLNILICGSQKFDDEAFVISTLDTFYASTNGNFRKVFTSKFAGACEFAREWANNMNKVLPPERHIQVVDYAFDMILEQKNQSFYEDSEIPAFAVANNPFFKKGKEELVTKGVNFVVCFPNKEGKLGASTQNIQRFATLATIPVFDCSELLGVVKQYQEETKVQNENQQGLGFNNRHPSKR